MCLPIGSAPRGCAAAGPLATVGYLTTVAALETLAEDRLVEDGPGAGTD